MVGLLDVLASCGGSGHPAHNRDALADSPQPDTATPLQDAQTRREVGENAAGDAVVSVDLASPLDTAAPDRNSADAALAPVEDGGGPSDTSIRDVPIFVDASSDIPLPEDAASSSNPSTDSAADEIDGRAGADAAVTLDAGADQPGSVDSATDVPPPDAAPAGPAVVFNELMYHPVLENAAEDNHEFIELYNRRATTVDLSGWQISGDVTFTFPPGTTIAAHGFRVIARSKIQLAAVASYHLDSPTLLGDYLGQLNNSSGMVQLSDAGGAVVDSVAFDSHFPWPLAPDAMGAGESWLAPALLPLSDHQYRGYSLQRVDPDVSATEIANWVPSPLDGASPGAPNGRSGIPPRIVLSVNRTPSGGGAVVRATDTVTIRVTFSTMGPLADVQLESFVDDVEQTGEPVSAMPMTASNGGYEAIIPAHPDNSIVRFRITGDLGSGREIISPRPSDPFAWHGYLVEPGIATTSRLYEMFIKKSDWTQLWDNINFSTDDHRVTGPGRCQIRDSWDADVPAIFANNGEIYDVRVRYQGSRWNRQSGQVMDGTRFPYDSIGPARPAPLLSLSWNISFPRYKNFDKRKTLILNKLNQSCPGLYQTLGERLYGAGGVPVSKTKYARLHINGAYYNYALDVEHPDSDMMKRYAVPPQPVGDLFKSFGLEGDEGPYGTGDERQLTAACGYTPLQRYGYTYERSTNTWKDNSDLMAMIDALHTARASLPDTTALRAYFAQNWDVTEVTNYLAVRNWAASWDDYFQNHYLYRNGDAGKWSIFPWDLDLEWGVANESKASSSFYVGEEGNSNRSGLWNYLKDSFIKAYRTELNARWLQLDATVLSPSNVKAKIDEAYALYNLNEAQQGPAPLACSPAGIVATMKAFADDRHTQLLDSQCSAGPCGLKGEYFTAPVRDFSAANLQLSRTDAAVDFDWGNGAPAATLPADNFQVRWTGKVTPAYSETYTFFTTSDDGIRLWVNGTLLIDNWTDHGPTENSGTIALVAGQAYDLRLEFYENSGGAVARLQWSSASQTKKTVPTSRFTPAP